MKFEQNSFFLSDPHFNHANILKYDNRPFENISVHDRTIIENWNRVVTPKDDVFLLGDFVFGRREDAAKYWWQLNGRKHVVHGNHDKALKEFCKHEEIPCVGYMEIKIRDEETSRKWRDIVLCHYPIAEWNKAHHGAYHLYGHTHGNSWYDREFQSKYRCMNVGAPCIDYTPISYAEIKEKLKSRGLITHH